MRYRLRQTGCFAWLILLAVSPVVADEVQDNSAGIELFEKQIRPVLVDRCYSCHSKSAEQIEGGLELDTAAGMARGGDSGTMIIRRTDASVAEQQDAAVESSLLLRVLRHEEDVPSMPPDEEKLDESVIRAFEQWIELGAPDPRDDTEPTAEELRLEEQLDHWAYQAPTASEPPAVEQTDWPRGTIDSFILARLESEGMKPVADATRATLARRLYFDLIGLPPLPVQVSNFVEDRSPDAAAKLVDRLLASPRFGERWGRHWLDVVRFAESSGKEFNFTYPHAWPYRDYVIDAFNDDKPYDLFVREQVAGDLLPDSPYESSADRESRLIATSLLSFGTKRHNTGGMGFRMEIVDDQIDVTCRAILGVTVSCAKCHDHKFDPIPMKDYYGLAGIFLSTEPLYGTIQQKYSNNPTDLLPIGRNAAELHAAVVEYQKLVAAVEKPAKAKQTEIGKANVVRGDAEQKKNAAQRVVDAIAAKEKPAAEQDSEESSTAENAEAKKPDEAAKKLADPPAPSPQELLAEATKKLKEATTKVDQLKAELVPLNAAVDALKKNSPPPPAYAMSARDRAAPADTKIALRGDISKPGDVAPRGFLSALEVADVPEVEPSQSGRLQLAHWMTSQHNPLPARVMVNRIWHHLYGRGLVETVDNFGRMGVEPSHPELLDTLAVQFMHDGWSVKRMIRAMVLSRTYQLGCSANAENSKIDPDNRLLWRSSPRRLTVEVIRDAILAVSGQLDLEPPQGSTATALGDQMVRGVDTKKLQPPNRHRSIFLPVIRDYTPEIFNLFDFPSASLVSGKRAVTNVPAQALFLRNSDFVTEQATHAATRLLANKQATDDQARVDLAMQWALARSATDEERQDALALVKPIQAGEAKGKNLEQAAWATLFKTLFATAEFRYLVDIQQP